MIREESANKHLAVLSETLCSIYCTISHRFFCSTLSFPTKEQQPHYVRYHLVQQLRNIILCRTHRSRQIISPATSCNSIRGRQWGKLRTRRRKASSSGTIHQPFLWQIMSRYANYSNWESHWQCKSVNQLRDNAETHTAIKFSQIAIYNLIYGIIHCAWVDIIRLLDVSLLLIFHWAKSPSIAIKFDKFMELGEGRLPPLSLPLNCRHLFGFNIFFLAPC